MTDAANKTTATDGDVTAFVGAIADEQRQRDAHLLVPVRDDGRRIDHKGQTGSLNRVRDRLGTKVPGWWGPLGSVAGVVGRSTVGPVVE